MSDDLLGGTQEVMADVPVDAVAISETAKLALPHGWVVKCRHGDETKRVDRQTA